MTKWRWNYSYHLWFRGDELVFVAPKSSKGIVVPKIFALNLLDKIKNGFTQDDFINYSKNEIQNPEEVFSDLVMNKVILELKPIKIKLNPSKNNLEDNLGLEDLSYGAHDFGLKASSVLKEVSINENPSFVLIQEGEARFLSSYDTSLNNTKNRFFQVQTLQESRYSFVLNLLDNCGYKTILDFGCGEGGFLNFLRMNHSTIGYLGTDINIKRLNKAIQKFGDKLFVTDTNKLDVSVVLMLEVLEHMPKDEALNLLQEHLNAGRDIILTMPNKAYDLALGFNSVRHPEHVHEWTESEFKQVLEQLKQKGFEGEIWSLGRGLENGIQPTLACHIRSYHGHKPLP